MIQTSRREHFNPHFFNIYILFALVGLVGCSAYLLQQLLFQKTTFTYLYLLMIVQVTPFIIQFGKQRFNFIGFTLFNHFFCYSVPKLNTLRKGDISQFDLINISNVAIQELIICSLILLAAYYFFRIFFFYSFVERENYQLLSLNRVQLLVVALYVIGMPLFIEHLPSWTLIFHFAAVAADMVLLMCSHSPGNENLSRLLRFGVFVSAILYFFKTGMLTMVGNLAGYIFIASCLRREYKMLIIPVLLTVIGSAVQVVKGPFRNMIYSNPQMQISERIETLGGLLYTQYFEDVSLEDEEETGESGERREIGDSLLHGFSRLGDDSLERVLAWTPSLVPFWDGASYESIPYLFIPRFLWSDKPSRHIWNRFGRAYGILGEDDYQTSVGMSYFAEGYMNFGFTGMYAVAIIMALLIAGVERLSYYFLGGYFYFTFMAFLMPVMAYATDLGSVFQSIMIVSAVLFLFRKQFKRMALRDEYS